MKSKRLSVRERAVMKTVEGIIQDLLDGVSVSIFDLSKISDAGKKAAEDCLELEKGKSRLPDDLVEDRIRKAISDMIQKVRKN